MTKLKLVRDKLAKTIEASEGGIITVTDKHQLNELYILKIREELNEIVSPNFEDEKEIADLYQAVLNFMDQNKGTEHYLDILLSKRGDLGDYTNKCVIPNPNNPSNAIYYPELQTK